MAVTSAESPRDDRLHGLPAEVTSFVGRRQEMAEIRRLLSRSRLVTLTGVGGVGKTRLAARVGTALRRTFADDAWMIELGGLDDPALLPAAVLDGLGVRDHSARPAMDVLLSHLRNRRMLVILDNCEHITDACTRLVEAALAAAPGVVFLVTSRQTLGIAGERVFAVPPLGLADGSSDAVRLFSDRAEAVAPDFTVNPGNREAVEGICRTLDGVPLAIELAAVRVRALSVEQVLERLANRFRLLSSGSRAVLPRHRSLRALVEWSWGLCTDAERSVWARASVFCGGLEPEAAEAVCAGDGMAADEVVDALIGLADKSVLVREERGDVGVRYRLLETIKAYGLECLQESGKLAETQRRHREHYRSVAARMNREWFGPDQVAWFIRMRVEHDNLRCAMDSAQGDEAGLAIAAALRFYWTTTGTLNEGRRRLDTLLSAVAAPAELHAEALLVSAWLAVLQGDPEAAEPRLDQCRALAGESAENLFVRGMAALTRGDPAAADTLLRDAYSRHRANGDARGTYTTLVGMAATSLALERDDTASLAERSRAGCEELGDLWIRSFALALLGRATWQGGSLERATKLIDEALRIKRLFDDQPGTALCIEVLAWIAADRGNWERAARLLGALHQIWESTGGSLFRLQGPHDEQYRNLAREALGGRAFTTAYAEGAAMTVEHAIAYALQERIPGVRRVLTPRETEVARLVAQGMTNKEIAAELVISLRTAEGHIEHILSKLGFTSRAQIADWAGDSLTARGRRP
jgi:predicted ATPase/DNA-binding CsgD family transcriptional regulator